MVTLRCTRLVHDRLRLPRQMPPELPPSTGRLGDWYVHVVRFGRPEFVIATSERSLLDSLGVSGETVARKIAAMESVTFGRATDRRVLGSMNELAFQASVLLARGDDLPTISCRLAEILMSVLGTQRGGSSQGVWIEHCIDEAAGDYH